MPFLDEDPAINAGQRIDVPKGFTVTPGADDVSGAPPERPAWNWGAAFRRQNEIAALASSESAWLNNEPEEGFNPWDRVRGTPDEPNFRRLAEARNERRFNAIKADIARENEDRKLLDGQPWWMSLLTEGPAAVLSPTTLLPGGAFVRGAKGGLSIAKSAGSVAAGAAAGTTAQELALQSIEQTRTLGESATSIGASVFLGGLLGGAGAALLSKGEWTRAVDALNRQIGGEGRADLPAPEPGDIVPASVGAAATERANLEDLTVAGAAAGRLAQATQFNPALRLLNSENPVARQIGAQTFENPLYLKMNTEGETLGASVETLMKEWNGGLATALRATDEAYPEARKAGFAGTAQDFREAVGRAMRRSDTDPDPNVDKVAKAWRASVFDPLKDAAIKAGLLPEDVSVSTAASYFSRMWNVNKLIRQEGRFKDVVARYYADSIGREYEQASQAIVFRLSKLDQEIADLNLTPQAREVALKDVEGQITALERKYPDIAEQADLLTEINQEIRNAQRAKDEKGLTSQQIESINASIKSLKEQAAEVKKKGGTALAAYTNTRADLRSRRRNIDLGVAGLQERSDRLLDSLAEIEEANFRGMERLVKKGQALERDLNRLDADALAERVDRLADSYSQIARKSEASALRAERTIQNIKDAADRTAARLDVKAQRAATEAQTAAPENVAGKKAEAKAAGDERAAVRAAADARVQAKLEKEAEIQRARSERMEKIAERLRLARDLDHDGLMAELKDAITKAMRETSAQSLARGERAASLGERMASLNPAKVAERVKVIEQMKRDAERAFFDRWEIRNLGEGVDIAPNARPDFSAIARTIADQAYDSLTGRTMDGGPRPEFMKITARGPMKDRTLNIPDELIEEWLEHDVATVGRRYSRIMGADVELANKFGDVNMTEQLQAVRDRYRDMRQGVTDEKALAKLADAEKEDIRDIQAVRDLLRGTYDQQNNAGNWAAITRSANAFNYIRSMGEVVLASLTDAVRPAMVHGLRQFMGDLPKVGSAGGKLAVREAQLAGNVAERVLQHRLGTLTEIMDPYSGRGPVETFLSKMTDTASKWNGIRMWTDMMKSVASVMTQNRILDDVSRYGNVSQKEKSYLAYLGIDANMAERIAKQFGEHGETLDGVRVANTEEWTDAVARRAYRAAMNKDVDSIIVQKGVADVPLFAQTPTGKMLLQFKGFALASHQRILLRGLQEDRARFLGGLVAMTAMGMFVTWAKALTGNRPDDIEKIGQNPGWWVAEGLDRSGVLAVPMELSNMFEKATATAGKKFNPLKAGFTAMDEQGSISQKNQGRNFMGSLLGPSGGLVEDALMGGAGVGMMTATGDDISKGRANALERLVPFNSYLGARQMIRYAVNPPE